MRNYTIPKYPEYDENIKMLENTDPADADSVFNPLFSKMINNTAAIRSEFNGITMKDMEIVNIPNTRDYDYLSLELGGNTKVTPENPALEIRPDNVAVIESAGEDGSINILSSGKNLIIKAQTYPQTSSGVTYTFNASSQVFTINGTLTANSAAYLWTPLNGEMVKLKAGETLTTTIEKVNGSATTHLDFRVSIGYYDGTPRTEHACRLLPADITGTKKNISFTTIKDGYINYVHLINQAVIGESFSNLQIRCQIEYENKSTEIEPFIGNHFIIPLKDTDGNTLEPLKSIQDSSGKVIYADKLFRDNDGLFKVERLIKTLSCTPKLITDNPIAFRITDDIEKEFLNFFILPKNFRPQIYAFKEYDRFYCNSFTTIADYPTNAFETALTLGFGQGPGGAIQVCMPKSDLQGYLPDLTDEQKKKLCISYINTLPDVLTYHYRINPAAQVQNEILHPDTQTMLNNLERTYNGTTVIMGTDEISPLITSTYARGAMSTLNAKQISGCEVNDEIIGDRNLLTASKTVELINSMITARMT